MPTKNIPEARLLSARTVFENVNLLYACYLAQLRSGGYAVQPLDYYDYLEGSVLVVREVFSETKTGESAPTTTNTVLTPSQARSLASVNTEFIKRYLLGTTRPIIPSVIKVILTGNAQETIVLSAIHSLKHRKQDRDRNELNFSVVYSGLVYALFARDTKESTALTTPRRS